MLLLKQEHNYVDQAFDLQVASPLVLQLRPKLCAVLAAEPSLCTAG